MISAKTQTINISNLSYRLWKYKLKIFNKDKYKNIKNILKEYISNLNFF